MFTRGSQLIGKLMIDTFTDTLVIKSMATEKGAETSYFSDRGMNADYIQRCVLNLRHIYILIFNVCLKTSPIKTNQSMYSMLLLVIITK